MTRWSRQSSSALALLAGTATALMAPATLAQDLAASRAAWEAADIESYEYSYQRVCECHPDRPADTIVTVEAGEVVAVRYARDDYAQDIPVAVDRIEWFRTIDDLFDLIETAQGGAAVVRATFDAELGYPVSVYVDYMADLVGDEVDLTITRFSPAP